VIVRNRTFRIHLARLTRADARDARVVLAVVSTAAITRGQARHAALGGAPARVRLAGDGRYGRAQSVHPRARDLGLERAILARQRLTDVSARLDHVRRAILVRSVAVLRHVASARCRPADRRRGLRVVEAAALELRAEHESAGVVLGRAAAVIGLTRAGTGSAVAGVGHRAVELVVAGGTLGLERVGRALPGGACAELGLIALDIVVQHVATHHAARGEHIRRTDRTPARALLG